MLIAEGTCSFCRPFGAGICSLAEKKRIWPVPNGDREPSTTRKMNSRYSSIRPFLSSVWSRSLLPQVCTVRPESTDPAQMRWAYRRAVGRGPMVKNVLAVDRRGHSRMQLLPFREHLHELCDATGARLGFLGVLDPEQNSVTVA